MEQIGYLRNYGDILSAAVLWIKYLISRSQNYFLVFENSEIMEIAYFLLMCILAPLIKMMISLKQIERILPNETIRFWAHLIKP